MVVHKGLAACVGTQICGAIWQHIELHIEHKKTEVTNIHLEFEACPKEFSKHPSLEGDTESRSSEDEGNTSDDYGGSAPGDEILGGSEVGFQKARKGKRRSTPPWGRSRDKQSRR